MKNRWSISNVAALLLIPGCATLPENYAQYSSDYEFLHSVAKFNAPLAIPPEMAKGQVSQNISYVTAAYEDLSRYMSGAHDDVLSRSRLEFAIDKYCTDKGGKTEAPLSINERVIYACKNNDKYTVTIHFPGKERAGSDTGELYSYKYYVAMYSFSAKSEEAIATLLVSHYLAFEKNSLSNSLINNVNLKEQALSALIQQIIGVASVR